MNNRNLRTIETTIRTVAEATNTRPEEWNLAPEHKVTVHWNGVIGDLDPTRYDAGPLCKLAARVLGWPEELTWLLVQAERAAAHADVLRPTAHYSEARKAARVAVSTFERAAVKHYSELIAHPRHLDGCIGFLELTPTGWEPWVGLEYDDGHDTSGYVIHQRIDREADGYRETTWLADAIEWEDVIPKLEELNADPRNLRS